MKAVSRGAGFDKTDRSGKTLQVTDVQVEVEFVISTNGTVWGDSKSPVLKKYSSSLSRPKKTHGKKAVRSKSPAFLCLPKTPFDFSRVGLCLPKTSSRSIFSAVG